MTIEHGFLMSRGGITTKRYFYYTTWSLSIMAVMVAWAADGLTRNLQFLFPILLLTSLYLEGRPTIKKPRRLLSVLCWIGVIWYVLQIIITRDITLIGDAMVYLIWSHIGYINRKSRFMTILGASLVLCFSSLVLDPGVLSYLFFIIYLILGSFSLNAANFYLNLQFKSERKLLLDINYFKQFIKFAPVGILLSLSIFYLFPRVNQLFLDLPFQVKQRYKVGYSGEIDLGVQGELENDNEVALSVSSQDEDWLRFHTNELYLKGGSLDTFDGKRWSNSPSRKKLYPPQGLLQESRNLIKSKGQILSIIVNPQRHHAVLLPQGRMHLIKISRGVSPLYYDPREGALTRSDDSPRRYQYEVQIFHQAPPQDLPISSLVALVDSQKNDSPYYLDLDSSQTYLAIPPSIQQEPIYHTWRQEVGVSPQLSLLTNLSLIQDFFKKNYQASLINSFASDASLLHFMGDQRRGHCEYFSTAAVLLLRSLGVPSRVATGYRGGEYNELAKAILVKQLHAHAWVEFFIPDQGWSSFDPTPLAWEQLSSQFSSTLLSYIHAANYFFARYLVDYNLLTQRDLYRQVKKSLPKASPSSTADDTSLKPVFVVLFIIVVVILRYWWKRRRQLQTKPVYIRRFYSFLRSQGSQVEKENFESYRSFAKRLLHEGRVREGLILEFAKLVELDLYGHPYLRENIDQHISEFQSRLAREGKFSPSPPNTQTSR